MHLERLMKIKWQRLHGDSNTHDYAIKSRCSDEDMMATI